MTISQTKVISTEQESKDVFRVIVQYEGREYSDRFSLAGLKIAHSKDDNKDSLGYKIRAAMLKAVESKTKKKKETQDVRKISKQN